MIAKLGFIGIPSTDSERSRAFYVETLGLRPDQNARFEFWLGETCFAIWEPSRVFAAPPLRAPRAGHSNEGKRAA